MVKKIVMFGGGALAIALYVFGLIFILNQGPFLQNSPTPRMIVGGVFAMFATVLFFALPFIQTATQRD